MQGTNLPTLVIDEFASINEVLDELKLPENQVPVALGCIFSEEMQLARVPGKLVYSSGGLGGRVLTLHQLNFKDGSPLLVHQSSSYMIADALEEFLPLGSTESAVGETLL